ncbi:CsbD family protein [Nocardia sp. CA-128927]|uniref:microaggregate-binding protein 1 n=1 Tax=Nocardia sp. CA-128927 TaxID=3239975 RepID=UPI003D95D87C
MSEHESGPREGVEGVVEGVKGKAKEAAGVVTGDENLKGEGQAQQDKAESEREAAQKEAAAEKARAEANVDEARQASHQHDQ